MPIRIRRFAVLVTVLCLILLPVVALCEDNAVEIMEQRDGGTITLTAKLTNCLDATVTLNADLRNMTASAPLPVTIDTNGKAECPIVTLHIKDRSQDAGYHYRFNWRPGGRQKEQPAPYAYALPYKGGPHRVRQAYFGRFSHYEGSQDEYAVDWSMPVGTEVYAAREGTVVAIRSDVAVGGPDPKYKPDYNYIVIRHSDGAYAEYIHLQLDGVKVRLGDKVSEGQLIGLSGNTGYTSMPHLHFCVFNTISGQQRKTMPVEFRLPSGRKVTMHEGQSY